MRFRPRSGTQTPSGGLAFVNKRNADYIGLAADHPLRSGVDIGAAWDAHAPLLHPDDQEESLRVWSAFHGNNAPPSRASRACGFRRSEERVACQAIDAVGTDEDPCGRLPLQRWR
jgi:hypothetical protein